VVHGSDASGQHGGASDPAEGKATPDAVGIGVVGVVGAGLIGGSIVRACLAAEIPVLVTDRDGAAVSAAADAGAVAADLQQLRDQADVVFLCAPPTAIAELWGAWLQLAPAVGSPGAERRSIVMDVSSVKAPVVSGLSSADLPLATPDTVLQLSHPMAGRELSGWTAGDGRLFRGATWILAPHASVTGAELARSIVTVEAFGATVCCMDAGFHDLFAAVTSHIPHVLAFAFQSLVDDVDGTGWRRFSGGSLRDVLRISSSNPTLWTQILAGNADQLAPLLRDLADRLERFEPVTDVDAGQPRPLPPPPPERQLELALDAAIGDLAAELLVTAEQGLHLNQWTIGPTGSTLQLTFTPRLASGS
jgi:prephenate dehydrogenase